MKKSRLNKRINAVRKNIVVKKNLLNKLKKIKESRKRQPRKLNKQRLEHISFVKMRSQKIKKPKKRKRNKASNQNTTHKKQIKVSLRRLQNKPKPKNKLKKIYSNKISSLNSIFPNSINLRNKRNLINNQNHIQNKNHNLNQNPICKFKNFHEEHIEIPDTYPGDLWVHNNLLEDRDKPLEFFDEDYLKEVYSNHKKICYGI